MLAADNVAGKIQIIWHNNPGNVLHVWSLDPAWNWQSSPGNISPCSLKALGLEASCQIDLNGKGGRGLVEAVSTVKWLWICFGSAVVLLCV
ncbi:MAG: hypothetical protein ACK5N0_11130 [Synechococcaceae cyanobacterium]